MNLLDEENVAKKTKMKNGQRYKMFSLLEELSDMKSDLRVTLFADLDDDRLRLLLRQLPNNHLKTDVMRAFSLKIKAFLQKSLSQLQHQIRQKKSTNTKGAILERFKQSFLSDVNTFYSTLEEKKQVFDILCNLHPSLSSFLMQHMIMTHTKELKNKKLLFPYMTLIYNEDIRSEVMNTIGMKNTYFEDTDAQRKFLLSIPNLDLAVASTEKFARNPKHFKSFAERLDFVSALTDNSQKIRIYQRMMKEHSEHATILKSRIQEVKKEDNKMRQSYGLPPKYKV